MYTQHPACGWFWVARDKRDDLRARRESLSFLDGRAHDLISFQALSQICVQDPLTRALFKRHLKNPSNSAISKFEASQSFNSIFVSTCR